MLLRCRHASKAKFMKLRSDVLVKLQLLDNKRGKMIVRMLAFHSTVVSVTILTLHLCILLCLCSSGHSISAGTPSGWTVCVLQTKL